MSDKPSKNSSHRVAFLLSQVGGRSAQEFARLLAPLRLTPADAGILRFLSRSEGISQQNLAKALNMHPSRLVALLDALESTGLVVREPHATDRRLYSLKLTSKGNDVLHAIGQIASEHNQLMCTGLSSSECAQLESLLQRIAASHALVPGVHPGYRDVGKSKRPAGRRSHLARAPV